MIDAHIQHKFAYIPREMPRMAVLDSYHTLLIDSGLPSDMFNIICCTGKEQSQDVELSIRHFREKNYPFCWWVGFDSDPPWIEQELERHGLHRTECEQAMEADLKNPVSHPSLNNLEINRVTDTKGLEDFLSVMCAILPAEEHRAVRTFYRTSAPVWNAPESALSFFVGYVEGRPVAMSTLFTADGLCSIFDVIVISEMRGQGFGSALTCAAMQHGRDAGLERCFLTATNDAKLLYEKIGFKKLKEMCVYS